MSARSLRVALASAVVLSLLAGCGGSGSDAGGPAAPSKLDHGNYPTVPRDLEKERTPETGAIQEAIRLAGFVPLPMDLDNRLVFGTAGTKKLTAQHPPVGWVDPNDKFAEVVPGLIAGWRTKGSRRTQAHLGLNVELSLLRFGSAEQATHAMNVLPGETHKKYPPKGPLEIPGYPGQTFHTQFDAVESWIARGDLLVKIYVSNALAVPPDPAPLLDTAKRFLDKQFELLKGYTPTPVDKLPDLPVDPEGLLARTLPVDKPGTYDDPTGVYPVAAELHLRTRPDLMRRTYTDARVDLIATAGSQLYRTGDPAAAQRLLAALTAAVPTDFAPYDSPPGLPDAKCFKKRIGVSLTCYLTYEHLLAEVVAAQPQDLNQRLAAQYKLLVHGR
ncbi:hypothetical protein [Nocardia sp. NPDC048505]|uniref:DUF7373 family lipoprotein n=1 Tax=unclassified Nocardia TaxID=2637762 RepID=UPI0033C11E7A